MSGPGATSRAGARLLVVGAALAIGGALGRWSAGGAPDPGGAAGSPTVAPSTTSVLRSSSAEPSASASAPAGDGLSRAREGDLDALKTLDEKAAATRTTEEAVALEQGHATLARLDAETFVRDVAASPALLEDRATLAYGYRLALDEAAAPTLLAGLAAIDSPVVPELLHDLASRGEPGARLTLLARDLLEGSAVRARADKPLAIVLLLDAVHDCGTAVALLPRVESDADSRASEALARLHSESGCGPKGTDDCMSCLRDSPAKEALERATEAARARRFEPKWTVASGKR